MPYAEVGRVADTGPRARHPALRALPLPRRSDRRERRWTTSSIATLRIAEGRSLTRLGDCVVGARVAEDRELAPGGHVISSPESVFDLAGVYPLKMRVVGVLDWSDGPDDEAIFVDVKTAWVIQGLAHGHDDVSRPEAARPGARAGKDGKITANASVVNYNEITPENVDAFHFHGDPGHLPDHRGAARAARREVRHAAARVATRARTSRARSCGPPPCSTSCSTPCSRCARSCWSRRCSWGSPRWQRPGSSSCSRGACVGARSRP